MFESSKSSRYWLILALFSLMLMACDQQPAEGLYTGYIEAESLEVAAAVGGRLLQQAVSEGREVAVGTLLFQLEAEPREAALLQAQAVLREAHAALTDLEKGSRPQELAVIEAQLREADAQVEYAQAEQQRLQTTAAQNYSSRSELDKAVAGYKEAIAHRAALKHQLEVAQMPARDDALEAARQRVAAAEAQVSQAQWNLAQGNVRAAQAGTVEELYFRPGEYVNAGVPVLSLLLVGQYKVRFYVPPSVHQGLKLGQTVQVTGPEPNGIQQQATIRFLASEPEFTPPVLYGKDNREDLVFMVEAQFPNDIRLTPGVPVDVQL